MAVLELCDSGKITVMINSFKLFIMDNTIKRSCGITSLTMFTCTTDLASEYLTESMRMWCNYQAVSISDHH